MRCFAQYGAVWCSSMGQSYIASEIWETTPTCPETYASANGKDEQDRKNARRGILLSAPGKVQWKSSVDRKANITTQAPIPHAVYQYFAKRFNKDITEVCRYVLCKRQYSRTYNF